MKTATILVQCDDCDAATVRSIRCETYRTDGKRPEMAKAAAKEARAAVSAFQCGCGPKAKKKA